MIQLDRSDQAVGCEVFAEREAQPPVGADILVVGEPLPEGAVGRRLVVLAADPSQGLVFAVALVVPGERVDDESGRIALPFRELRREGVAAGFAAPELDGLELLLAPAAAGQFCAGAVRAVLGSLGNCLWWLHGEMAL